MRRFILATVAGAALLTGATAAGAQTFQNDGYAYGQGDGYAYSNGYGYRGPMAERGVGLQVGPVGVGVYADQPAYRDHRIYRSERRPVDNDTYNSRAFQSQETWPQSPPGGS